MKIVENDYVSFNTALLAKEVGFDELCDNVYKLNKEGIYLLYYEGDGSGFINNSNVSDTSTGEKFLCTRPLQSWLQKWIREKHLLHIEIIGYEKIQQYYYCIRNMSKYSELIEDDELYNTYEECLEAALQYCLAAIKFEKEELMKLL